MALPSRFERDVQDRRMRRQEKPRRAIQSHPPLMRRWRLAEDMQREPMKLPPGETGLPRHYIYTQRPVRGVEPPAQPSGRVSISNYTFCLHFRFLLPPFYFLLSTSS
jgi:hypothetical protein